MSDHVPLVAKVLTCSDGVIHGNPRGYERRSPY